MANSSLLHNFSSDKVERRQYERLSLMFPAWWLINGGADAVAAGIGVEISGGGIQFLLELRHQIAQAECSIVFKINDNQIRANVQIIETKQIMYNGIPWQHYRAKFLGLREADFDFIMSLNTRTTKGATLVATTAQTLPSRSAAEPAIKKTSVGDVRSFDMLPTKLKEDIVGRLVRMKRMAPVTDMKLALMSVHYAGIQQAADGDAVYHRFSIRTKNSTLKGSFVYDTHFLVSDDGLTLLVRE